MFDVQGQRLEGTEAEEMRDRINDMDTTMTRDWRRHDEEVRKIIRVQRVRVRGAK